MQYCTNAIQWSTKQKVSSRGAADVNGDNYFLQFGYPFDGHRLDGGTNMSGWFRNTWNVCYFGRIYFKSSLGSVIE